MENWPREEIPNKDCLYYRVHKNQMDSAENNDYIPTTIFRSRDGSMSTDWEKYSNPEKSRSRARIPEDNRILEMITGEVKNIPMIVQHAPDPEYNNRAHTNVFGLETEDRATKNEIRLKLSDIAVWANEWIIEI